MEGAINQEIIYKDLSYKLIGLGYQIFNELGFGLEEKIYAKAYEQLLIENKIPYIREAYCPIKINNQTIARNYFDFLIMDKIVLELKVGDYKYKDACSQLQKYLKTSNLKLGIIVRFMRDGAKIKRIVNLY